MLGALMAASIPAALGHSAISSVSSLYELAEASNPYLQPEHGLLLYLWAPVVVLSACIMLLAPGLILAIAFGAARTVGQWVVCGFALSLIIVSTAAAIVQMVAGNPLRGTWFVVVVFACMVAAFLVLIARSLTGPATLPSWQRGGALRTTVAMLIGPLLIMIALAPKFYWENFNGDGAHAFETARLLLWQAVPFWPASAGDVSNFPSLNSSLFAFPNSWFIRLFGESEAAARLPLILYLMGLYAGIIAIVEYVADRIPTGVEHALIWLQLAVYVIVMAFSATYNPYFADLALPATQDTQMMVCFLGLVTAFLYRSAGWICLFVIMLWLSLPSGLPLAGLFVVALCVMSKPRPWQIVIAAAVTMLGCMLIAAVVPALLRMGELPVPGNEYKTEHLADRFNPWSAMALILKHPQQVWPLIWSRVMYLLLPCGILPALILARWSRQDSLTRSLTLVTGAYYLLFFIQPRAALHQFVPVMIIPIVVFWCVSRMSWISWRAWLTAAAAIASITICLPRQMRLHTEARRVGSAIEDRIDGYERSHPLAFARSELLEQVIPNVWDAAETGGYGGSPLMWNFYAHAGDSNAGTANYVLQRADDPPPQDMRRVAHREGVALYVRSDKIWESHRALRPAVGFAAHVFVYPGGRTWVVQEPRATEAPS